MKTLKKTMNAIYEDLNCSCDKAEDLLNTMIDAGIPVRVATKKVYALLKHATEEIY